MTAAVAAIAMMALAPGACPTDKLTYEFGIGAATPRRVPPSQHIGERQAGFEPGSSVTVRKGYVTSDRPFLFSVPLPECNYRVTVTLGDAAGTSATTVKAETRRLMVDRAVTKKGERIQRSFVVNVRTPRLDPPEANAPGGAVVRLNDREQGSYSWDDKLTLEFAGAEPKLAAITIEPVDVPTIYLVGDSTVTDQRSEPAASWGQMLPAFFHDGIAVANHAESGETLKSFITGLRMDKALSRMKPGDFLLIQFGHNDQKAQWPQTYAPAENTYRSYLRVMITEARRRGATPVLVTSPERRNFLPDGHIRLTLAEYATAVRAVAAEERVPLVDLNAASIRIYEALGPERSPLAFSQGGRDLTHHNNYGAYLLANAVVEGLKRTDLALTTQIRRDMPAFDPSHPPLPDAIRIDESAARSTVRPRGN